MVLKIISLLSGSILFTIINYFGQRFWVFKEDEKKAKKQQNEEIPIEDSHPHSPKRSSRPSPSPPQSPKPKPKPAPAPSNPAVAELTSMGFSQEQAENALEATNGNVEQAVQLLLDNPKIEINLFMEIPLYIQSIFLRIYEIVIFFI